MGTSAEKQMTAGGKQHPALTAFGRFARKNAVFFIALTAALVTAFFVPPDAAYAAYFDWKTLTNLFCVLAVVCALRNVRFFTFIARRIVSRAGNARIAVLMLVYITFIGSMLIANDMALITFLPLGWLVLEAGGKQKLTAYVFILQNLAANLGGMLTPFGNPQNLYLYEKYAIPTGDFLLTMLPPFALSVVLFTVCCLFVRPEPLTMPQNDLPSPPKGKIILYLLLFAYAIAIVFRVVPYWTGLLLVPVSLLILDRKALLAVDYPLLGTFAAFFVFSGNLARIPAVADFFSSLLSRSVLLVSVLSCQCISNVPSAILLSRFTDNWQSLLLGVNIGGAGTLIASLASLITFRAYCLHQPGHTGKYLLRFSLLNFGFLALLTLFCLWLTT